MFIHVVQTKSWFEEEPEPALPDDDDDEFKDLCKHELLLIYVRLVEQELPKSSLCFFILAHEEKQEKTEAYSKLIDEIRERNRQREHEATFTEIWYTFVDPYATDVDERGSGK